MRLIGARRLASLLGFSSFPVLHHGCICSTWPCQNDPKRDPDHIVSTSALWLIAPGFFYHEVFSFASALATLELLEWGAGQGLVFGDRCWPPFKHDFSGLFIFNCWFAASR